MDTYKTEAAPKAWADGVPVFCAHDKIVDSFELVPNPANPNFHPDEQIQLLGRIIRQAGWRQPITVSTRSGFIVKGHGRLEAALLEGMTEVPVDYQNYASEAEEYADLVADNRLAELSEINQKKLADIFAEIDTGEIELEMTGYTEDEIAEIVTALSEAVHEEPEEEASLSLADRFIFPPTTFLNAREGAWTSRKEAWKSIGIKSEVGRAENMTYSNAAIADPQFYNKKAAKEKELGRQLTSKEFEENYYVPPETDNGTSIFDPVLCEVCIKWFSGEGARILDPFAGGSVRGIVAAISDRDYTGIDLRPEQIEANKEQWDKIKRKYPDKISPHWITGDSLKTIPTLQGKFDMIMSCPPYADLEVYSDDPADLSNMEYDDFLAAYREIIRLAVDRLEDNRFAVFVVGEVRGKDGNYISFVPDTIKAFEDAGANFYNEAILVTPISGMRFRMGKMFTHSRKLGKTHQNVLVFVKGDAKKATEFCGDVDGHLPEEFTAEEHDE